MEKLSLKNWPIDDVFNMIKHIISLWQYNSFVTVDWGKNGVGKTVMKLTLCTGGSSHNEEIINKVLSNNIFTQCFYYKWERGGKYYFEINPLTVGYLSGVEMASKTGITRQFIHRSDRFEKLNTGRRKLMYRDKNRNQYEIPPGGFRTSGQAIDSTKNEQQ